MERLCREEEVSFSKVEKDGGLGVRNLRTHNQSFVMQMDMEVKRWGKSLRESYGRG